MTYKQGFKFGLRLRWNPLYCKN